MLLWPGALGKVIKQCSDLKEGNLCLFLLKSCEVLASAGQGQTAPFTCTAAFEGEHVVAVTKQALPHRASFSFVKYIYIFFALSEVILSLSSG